MAQDIITGKWELREQTGGIIATIKYGPGNGNVYIFNTDKSFGAVHPNIPARTGTYAVKASANPGDWLLELQFLLNGQTVSENDSIRFGKNQLIFLPQASCCDIPAVYYERLP